MTLWWIISRIHAVLRLCHRIHMRHHDAIHAPIENTADQIGMRSAHAHDAECVAPAKSAELIRQSGFRFATVLQVNEHPVKAAFSRELCDCG